MLGSTNAIDGFVEMLGDVELVEDDLLLGGGNPGEGGLDVGLPHVHRDGLDALALSGAEPHGPEGFQALLLTIVGNEQDPYSFKIGHDGHVVVSAKKRLLVHAQPGELSQLTSLQPPPYSALHDSPDRFPANFDPARHRGHRRILRPVDDQPLEEHRKLRPRLRPWDSNLHDPVLCARNPWHPRVKSSLKLARVEVAPLSFPVIVDRGALSALRALRLGASITLQPHVNRLLLRIELDPLDFPWLAQAQNRRVQLPVSHRRPSAPDRIPSKPLPSTHTI